MSGSEQPANLAAFNDEDYINLTNCYTYALSSLLNPITGTHYTKDNMNPGDLAGIEFTSDYLHTNTAKAKFITAVQEDCVTWGGNWFDFYEVNAETRVPEGYYKVALVLAEGEDYHWFRQASDLNGRWAHKHGRGGPALDVDDTGQFLNGLPIVIPEDAYCYIGNQYSIVAPYSIFLGYFAVKPPSAYD